MSSGFRTTLFKPDATTRNALKRGERKLKHGKAKTERQRSGLPPKPTNKPRWSLGDKTIEQYPKSKRQLASLERTANRHLRAIRRETER